MAEAWTDLLDADLAQDEPMRQSTARALRDNPEGIAAGVAGAPRIQTAGLDDSIVTTAKLASGERMNTTNVSIYYAAIGVYGVGAYILGRLNSGAVAIGASVAGSSLSLMSFVAFSSTSGFTGALSGTWMNCGAAAGVNSITIWRRIA